MNLRLRIAAVLGVFVAVNALFVIALLWAYGVLLPGVVAGTIVFLRHGTVGFDLLQLPVSWSTVLVLVGAFLAAQAYYGYRRVLSGTRATAGADDHEVARIVRRLSMSVDVPEPDVRVVADDRPSCYTVGRLTDATIVVTTGVVERLDEDELAAVLAHEIAHIANRDVTLMTITTLFLEIADRTYHAARLARRAASGRETVSGQGRLALQWFLPLVVLTYVLVAPVVWLFPIVADWATRTLSQAREFAADAGAARITGTPLALATALVALSEATTTPGTDLRSAKTRALCIVPTELITGRNTASLPEIGRPTDPTRRREQITTWLEAETSATSPSAHTNTSTSVSTSVETHPPIDERIRRLSEMAAEQEERP
ncbi:M48 family metalloprotease [Natronorubrum sp. JWXQ-INN-674]|uniref:M48 family metalloprotease n=1 Tax=Natronorubrum halalkaliphilum TaxID=2691917 RepID=A0A6B0VRF0_9EURY|nr:M48 family metalloprotease [Natronorubrum halalkaliphilum]MXV63657.1 M48 family metalloprotease [Natronorubrum halalkaliphilum]